MLVQTQYTFILGANLLHLFEVPNYWTLLRCETIAPFWGAKLLNLVEVPNYCTSCRCQISNLVEMPNYCTFLRCQTIAHFWGAKLLHLFEVPNYCTFFRCKTVFFLSGDIYVINSPNPPPPHVLHHTCEVQKYKLSILGLSLHRFWPGSWVERLRAGFSIRKDAHGKQLSACLGLWSIPLTVWEL